MDKVKWRGEAAYMPTKRQIAAECKKIRAEWSEQTKLTRAGRALGNAAGTTKLVLDLPECDE